MQRMYGVRFPIVGAVLASLPAMIRRLNSTGPGKRSVLSRRGHGGYSGAELRALRAERGVGRPPHMGKR